MCVGVCHFCKSEILEQATAYCIRCGVQVTIGDPSVSGCFKCNQIQCVPSEKHTQICTWIRLLSTTNVINGVGEFFQLYYPVKNVRSTGDCVAVDIPNVKGIYWIPAQMHDTKGLCLIQERYKDEIAFIVDGDPLFTEELEQNILYYNVGWFKF